MDKLEAIFNRLESMFEKWLADFENEPIKTGLKALIVFYIVRFAYRSFK